MRIPEVMDVGEQLFGSDHLFEIATPFNVAVGRGPARIAATVEGDPSFRIGVIGANEPDPTTILVDEAGRIQVSGDFKRLARFVPAGSDLSSAVQAERAARSLTDIALSRSLKDWRASIHADDTTR